MTHVLDWQTMVYDSIEIRLADAGEKPLEWFYSVSDEDDGSFTAYLTTIRGDDREDALIGQGDDAEKLKRLCEEDFARRLEELARKERDENQG